MVIAAQLGKMAAGFPLCIENVRHRRQPLEWFLMDDLYPLRIFRAAAKHLSFTRAAEDLFLTQSAVSHQIAALERDLGTILFNRAGRQVELTEPGRVLLAQMPRLFAALEEAERSVKQAAKPDLGRMRIGVSPTACQFLIPESMREFRESYPEYSLSVTVGDSPMVLQQLVDGEIDLGIMIRADRNKQLTFHNLFEDDLGFVVSPLHPWAKTGKVDRRRLGEEHFLMYSRGSADLSDCGAASIENECRLAELHRVAVDGGDQGTGEARIGNQRRGAVDCGGGIAATEPRVAAFSRPGVEKALVPGDARGTTIEYCGADFFGVVSIDGGEFGSDCRRKF